MNNTWCARLRNRSAPREKLHSGDICDDSLGVLASVDRVLVERAAQAKTSVGVRGRAVANRLKSVPEGDCYAQTVRRRLEVALVVIPAARMGLVGLIDVHVPVVDAASDVSGLHRIMRGRSRSRSPTPQNAKNPLSFD